MRPTRSSFLRSIAPLAATLLGARAAAAAATEDPPEGMVKKMLEATKNRSYDDFLTDADDTVRAKLTLQQFEAVANMVGPRLKQGYKLSYLTKLRKGPYATYLWKVEFADGKDEALVTMSIKNGKVAGIFIN
jgi:hypothetical protein